MKALKVLCATIIASSAFISIATTVPYANIYNQSVQLYRTADEIVEFVDDNGNIWAIDGKQDYFSGRTYKMTLFDNGTGDKVYDDIVISVK